MSGPGEGPASESYAEVTTPESDPTPREYVGGAGDTIALVPANTFDSSVSSSTPSLSSGPSETSESQSSVDRSPGDESSEAVASAGDRLATSDSSDDGPTSLFEDFTDEVDAIVGLTPVYPDSDVVVIGKISRFGPSYFDVAEEMKATHFYFEFWTELVLEYGPELMWEYNVAFLLDQHEKGKDIFLTHDPEMADFTFKDEVAFLEYLGYEFARVGDLWHAIPPESKES